ncbi:hypothetical protein WMY93_033708 [Mugilogobius chulae]|uniref:TATA-box binding protein n=1 Tax=Mugilogobius chulae TaxID=88201 RepID=A0AAW0MHF1_9GOBI
MHREELPTATLWIRAGGGVRVLAPPPRTLTQMTCPLTPMNLKTSGVSTVNLGCPLDLKFTLCRPRNAEFAAVIMRIREPRTTALIFSSGKMVCTGAKSEEQSRLAARKYARVVQKLEGLVLTQQQFSRMVNLASFCSSLYREKSSSPEPKSERKSMKPLRTFTRSSEASGSSDL